MARAAVPGRLTGGPAGRLAWRRATLLEARRETALAVTLVFDIPDWPGHLAGQHVDVRLTADDGYTAQRSYSLAGPADGGRVELAVQQVDGGEVSGYLVDGLTVGEQVEVRGPVGGWFVWRPAAVEPVLLVAGGSGIVPLMAMIRARRAARSRAPFRLIYSVRTPADAFFAHELRFPPVADGGVEVAWVHTREAPPGYPRPVGRIRPPDLARHGWPADLDPNCFVCGPTAFVEAVAGWLVDAGHDPDRIRTERFGPSGG